VALVHDDQVEEVRGEVAVETVRVSSVSQRLVKPEVDLASGLRLALELPDRAFTERGDELASDRLVDQDVAVREVEDARLAVTAPGAHFYHGHLGPSGGRTHELSYAQTDSGRPRRGRPPLNSLTQQGRNSDPETG